MIIFHESKMENLKKIKFMNEKRKIAERIILKIKKWLIVKTVSVIGALLWLTIKCQQI